VIITETKLKGAFVIEPERIEDERGFFARSFCSREFKENGLETDFVQCNISFNNKEGTLRGLHYQTSPHEEAKLIRCTMGAIYDVIVDIRPDSLTYKKWVAFELSQKNRKMIYVPKSFAHGFLTLTDNTEVFYQMSWFYTPDSGRGIRWNDPELGIKWPSVIKIISKQDAGYPDFSPSKI
jgi:dTDP-4-dehydrorhamnose 3,5-epimerase